MEKALYHLSEILLIIGGLNWGLAIFDINLVEMAFGSIPIVRDIVYGLVGLSAIYLLVHKVKNIGE